MRKKAVIILIVVFGALLGMGYYLFHTFVDNSLHNPDDHPVVQNGVYVTLVNQYHFELRSNFVWPMPINVNDDEIGETMFEVLYHHQFAFDDFASINPNTLNKKITVSAQVNLVPTKNYVKQYYAIDINSTVLTNLGIPKSMQKTLITILHNNQISSEQRCAAIADYLTGSYRKYIDLLLMIISY